MWFVVPKHKPTEVMAVAPGTDPDACIPDPRTKAAVRLQAHARGRRLSVRFQRKKAMSVRIQGYIRGQRLLAVVEEASQRHRPTADGEDLPPCLRSAIQRRPFFVALGVAAVLSVILLSIGGAKVIEKTALATEPSSTCQGPTASLADAAEHTDDLYSTIGKALDETSFELSAAGPTPKTAAVAELVVEDVVPELKVDAGEKPDEVGPTLEILKLASPKAAQAEDDGVEVSMRLLRVEAARPQPLLPRLPRKFGNLSAKPAVLECDVDEPKKQDAPPTQPQPRRGGVAMFRPSVLLKEAARGTVAAVSTVRDAVWHFLSEEAGRWLRVLAFLCNIGRLRQSKTAENPVK